jgi:hypothetical protein
MQSVVAKHRSAMLAMIGPIGVSLAFTPFAAEERSHLLQHPANPRREFSDIKNEGVCLGTLPAAVNSGFMPLG